MVRTRVDAGLGAAERASSVAWHRTFEEHFHQAFEHQLFLGRGGAERVREFAGGLPPVPRRLVPVVFPILLERQLKARGMGRHTEAEILQRGKAGLDAFAQFLADRPYAFGDEPTELDACAFGFLAASIYVRGDNPLFQYAASLPNLVAHCERIRARYFPETLGE